MNLIGGAGMMAKFVRIAKAVDGPATTGGLQRVGEMISGDAKRIATREEVVDTGRLRASFTYSIDGKQFGFEDKSDDKKNPSKETDQVNMVKNGKEVHIGTNVEYAAAQEFGDAKGREGRPMLTVAFQEDEQDITKVLGKEIYYEITKKNMTGFGVL